MPWTQLLLIALLFALIAPFTGSGHQAAERAQAQRAEDRRNRGGCWLAGLVVALVAVLMIAAAGGLS